MHAERSATAGGTVVALLFDIGKSGGMSPLNAWPNGATRFSAALLLMLYAAVASAQQPASVEADSEPLKISVTGIAPVITPEGDGYLDRILRELFTRAHVAYRLIPGPPRRGVRDTDSGVYDALIAPFPQLPRPVTGAPFSDVLPLPEPLIPTELSGMYTRSNMILSSVEDFSDYRLAYLQGWKQAEMLFEDHENVEQVSNPVLLMEMLAKDRVDVVFFSTAPGEYIAREIGLENVRVSRFRIKRHWYLHFNKRHASLLPVLEKHLAAMKVDGTMDTILADYSIDW